jgi:BirA family transcriptional regulator, biotin operon repressor / biotin---[acetyl-CoA-carboxylase] ligase
MSADLKEDTVAALLRTRILGRNYRFFPECHSTSDLVAESAMSDTPEGMLIAADTQTGGRGRMGRVWHSPPGQNLYFSMLLRPTIAPAAMPPLTLLIGASLATALNEALPDGLRARLKWPNDVLFESEPRPLKVAGILTEMATASTRVRHVVVGVGLNVNVVSFPDELKPIATSLALVAKKTFSRTELLCAFLEVFESTYATFLREGAAYAVDLFRQHAIYGLPVRFADPRGSGVTLAGMSCAVDEGGALIAETADGIRHRVVSVEP